MLSVKLLPHTTTTAENSAFQWYFTFHSEVTAFWQVLNFTVIIPYQCCS